MMGFPELIILLVLGLVILIPAGIAIAIVMIFYRKQTPPEGNPDAPKKHTDS